MSVHLAQYPYLVDIFYPSIGTVFSKEGGFQQPQAIALRIRCMLECSVTATFVVTGMRPAQGQALPAKLLGSAVYIESGSESASCFMVCHAYTDKLCKVYLITNRHAIPQQGRKAAIRVRVTIDTFSTPEIKYLTVPIVGDDGHYLPTVRVHPRFDVAAIKITQDIKSNSVDCCFIDTNLFATKEVVTREKLTLGDEILVLGYPAGIYEEKNTSPILRQGVIATDPKRDFSVNQQLQQQFGLPPSIPGFLIELQWQYGHSEAAIIQPSGGGCCGGKRRDDFLRLGSSFWLSPN